MVNGTVLLLPPDPECSVPNQLRVGGGLGAAVLVVVAGAAEDNLVSVASSATTSLFTGKTPNGVESPSTVLVENSVDTSGSGEDRPNPERAQQSGNIEGRRGASVDVERGVLGSVAGFASGPSAAPEERPGDTCSPLTVVVGNEEGERVLEWLRGARGAGKDRDTGGDDGEGSVTASLVKREDVGKLWGDVLWASDPRNWPAGVWVHIDVFCYARAPALKSRANLFYLHHTNCYKSLKNLLQNVRKRHKLMMWRHAEIFHQSENLL